MKAIATRSFRYLSGKIMVGLVLATMIGGLDASPALAGHEGDHGGGRGGDHGGPGRGHDNGRHEGRGRGYDRGHYRGGRGYRTYGYVAPVYVAPPVFYAPVPEPGVSIFLPTIHIR